MENLEAIAKRMVDATRAFVARAEAALAARIDDLDTRLKSIPAGPQGPQGVPGESIRGEKGEPGDRGESVKGDKGDTGERGAPGESIKGDSGPAGKDGKDGADGKDGKDADAEAIFNQLRAEMVKEVAELPPPKDGADGKDGLPGECGAAGARGEVGPAGESIRGDAGPAGKDGASIHPDTVMLMVRDAVEKAVATIPSAKDGQPGRDAAEMVLLPSIDESRSYPAGTWASHDGGLIRAARLTDPVTIGLTNAGWNVMVEGISAIVVTQGDDPREISVAAMLTSGTKAVSQFKMPVVLDKGVWREGAYEKGDGVSWDGSFWIAQKQTAEKPGTSDAWRLSTKRGRDGKDGKSFDAPPPAREPVRLK